MKYLNLKRYKFSTIFKNINTIWHNFFKIIKLISFKGYSVRKIFKYLDPKEIKISKYLNFKSYNINNYIDNLRATTEANDNIVGDNWNNILGYTGSFDIWKVPSSNRIPDSQIATKIFILPETTTLRKDATKEEVVELESTDLLRLKDIN